MSFISTILNIFQTGNLTETKHSSVIKNDDIVYEEKTIYFRDGELYEVIPDDGKSYYDAKYIVSDGITYDLESVEDINRIQIPKFKLSSSFVTTPTTSLDYVIRMKAGNLFNRKEKELCSACLWKSTELMLANTHMGWRKDDYTRLIYWHVQLEMYEEVEKAKNYLTQKGIVFTKVELNRMNPKPKKTSVKKDSTKRPAAKKKEPQKEKISYAEKELAIVQRITLDDMQSLNMPFVCNTKVKKIIQKGGHPFAYMDIIGDNLNIARNEIDKMNKIINQSLREYPKIPKTLKIDFGKLVFYSKEYGYTRIMCNPKTYSGKPSKYPCTLSFMTDLSNLNNSTHGELVYDSNGDIGKAKVCFWKNRKHAFLTYKTIDGILTLAEIDSNL